MGNKAKALSKELDAVVSLNISHLHDAANFFALLKNQIDSGEELTEIQQFSKGAAYHFRSLFEELKATKELINQPNLSTKEQMQMLYGKEILDLNDLLELEILQLSHKRRVKLNSEVNQRAEILGNFGLLSKLLINIVENALKHSNEEVAIELKDSDSKHWEIKIKSSGTKIPENIANDLKSSPGHGLSAVADIINFHGAEIKIHSLDEGSSIGLRFKKENKIIERSRTKLKTQNKKLLVLASLIIFSSIASVSYAISAISFSKAIEQQLSKNYDEQIYRAKMLAISDAYINQDQAKYSDLKKALVENTSNEGLASYALLMALSQKDTNPIWQDEALNTADKIDGAYELELSLAARYLGQRDFKKGLKHQIQAIKGLVSSNNRELKVAREIIKQKGVEYYLASISTNSESPETANNQVKKLKVNKKSTTLPSKSTSASKENISKPQEQFNELNKMIAEQDQTLGLDLEL
jgi:hypothetical protein